MNIHFISNKAEKLFWSEDGKSHYKRIRSFFKDKHLEECMLQRIHELVNAESLLDIKRIQNANLHPLKGGRRYELAIDVDTDTNMR